MNVLAELNLAEPQPLPELPELLELGPGPTQKSLNQKQSPTSKIILSGIDGHDFDATPAVRSKVALTDDGILYIADGAKSDVLVRSYIAMLDRRNSLSEGKIIPYKEIRTVPYTEIQRFYTGSADNTATAASDSQRTTEESQTTSMIAEAAQEQASDIFIEIYDGSAEIHYRIAGDIERRFSIKPELAKRLIRTIYDSMSESTSDAHYDASRDQTGRIARKHTDGMGLHQVRVSTGPTDEDRPFMALRLHYDLGEPRSLVELGFSLEHQADISEMTNYASGIILFSGPTGSGKSTTLANHVGAEQKRDNSRRKVISLEDPPEIPIFGTVQKAVSRKGLGRQAEGQAWIEAFETLMRWNPDWIVAGELRLRETMDAALKAALTNHLTWGMLHASSATLVPTRLQEAGIEMGYLSDPEIFRLFANQSLAPQLCPHCSIPYEQARNTLSVGQINRIEKHCAPDTIRMRGPGCKHCYRGALRIRTVCAEIVRTDRTLLSIFRKEGALAMRRHWVREQNGQTKAAHMIQKINAGLIDPVDAERIVLPINDDDQIWGT